MSGSESCIQKEFEQYLEEATTKDFCGWDFSAIRGRWMESQPSWNYTELVIQHLADTESLLDMGTGGGEFLSSLCERPQNTCATEGYSPNVQIAKNRLEPLGIKVFHIEKDEELPFSNNSFDLIINRHESFDATEVYRILKPDGLFITQQVGGRDNIGLNEVLQDSVKVSYENWTLKTASHNLSEAGLTITKAMEEYPPTEFWDIGAIIYYLKAIPWQIPGFEIMKQKDRLFELHKQIKQTGSFRVNSHRFYIESVKA
jgi:SAM-dependent methyltransferase